MHVCVCTYAASQARLLYWCHGPHRLEPSAAGLTMSHSLGDVVMGESISVNAFSVQKHKC